MNEHAPSLVFYSQVVLRRIRTLTVMYRRTRIRPANRRLAKQPLALLHSRVNALARQRNLAFVQTCVLPSLCFYTFAGYISSWVLSDLRTDFVRCFFNFIYGLPCFQSPAKWGFPAPAPSLFTHSCAYAPDSSHTPGFQHPSALMPTHDTNKVLTHSRLFVVSVSSAFEKSQRKELLHSCAPIQQPFQESEPLHLQAPAPH